MADVFNKDKRRVVMRSIKSKNSNAELIVFRHLRHNGIYFQKHYTKAPGKPDVALPRKKKAVFIDGDFWHGRDWQRRLKGRSDTDPWIVKIKRNKERDKAQRTTLRSEGWVVLSVWESDILRKKTRDIYLQRIQDFLCAKKPN